MYCMAKHVQLFQLAQLYNVNIIHKVPNTDEEIWPIIVNLKTQKFWVLSRATPNMIGKYRLALQLYKTFNNRLPEKEWLDLNFVQTNARRQTEFNILRSNRLQIGLNTFANKFHELNGMIPLEWFNRSVTSFKILCKLIFLTFEGWQKKKNLSQILWHDPL